MQVNAINSFSNVHFQGKNDKKAPKKEIPAAEHTESKGFMSKLSGPVAAALFMVPVATLPTSCDELNAIAIAGVEVPYYPPCPPDKDEQPKIDWEVQDSLLTWLNDYLDVPVEGLDNDKSNKALNYVQGEREWFYNRPEEIKLNLPLSDENETRYDYVLADSVKNDLRITKVNPGDITIITKDGKTLDNAGGLMFNEDGYKSFIHSNGKDSLHVYPKIMSGDSVGKYAYRSSITRGYLDKNESGNNILMVGFITPETEMYPPSEEHYVNVKANAITAEEIKELLSDKPLTKDEEE